MYKTILKFRGVAGHMVLNEAAKEAGVRKFVGWRFVEVKPSEFGFQLSSDADEVAFHEDYPRFVKEGALVPADQATADACGVPFVDAGALPVKKAAKTEEKGV